MSKQPPKTGAAAPKPPPPAAERSILDLILEIREKKVDPALISTEDRRACVAHLCAEGFSVPEIAQVLKRSERTVTRDRRDLEEAAALEHDPALAGRLAGRLLAEASLCIDRIRRVSRDRDTPPNVKVDAERACFQILSEVVQRLQSLGWLPTATQRVEADLTHHVGDVPDYENIQDELQRLTAIAAQTLPEGSPALGQLGDLRSTAERASISTQLAQVRATIPAVAEGGAS